MIHANHVTTVPDTPLHTLCEQIYTAALHNLALANAPVPLDAILTATFDPAHRAFVLADTSSALLATLSADARACILAQAIAGIVAFLRSVALSSPQPPTAESVAAKLRRFEAGEERTRLLAAVEAWPGWGDCFEKAQIGGIIMQAVGMDAVAEVAEKFGAGAVSVLEGEQSAEAPDLFDDGPHFKSELGVPGQFTIMALN